MMRARQNALFDALFKAAGGDCDAASVEWAGTGRYRSHFPVSELAEAAIASAACAAAEFIRSAGDGPSPAVTVDRRLASLWFGFSIRPQGWSLPPAWDPIAGDYEAQDGWIRLHTNAPHHRQAALRVLGTAAERDAVARAVARRRKDELEAEVVAGGGCAAAMHTIEEWQAHPQGAAVEREPLVTIESTAQTLRTHVIGAPERPLQGIRVLDLTRVLAGPIATRFLAALGADVLRIDPPDWDEASVAPEVTLGKRCARLDLRDARDAQTFRELLSHADVLVHGYRPGALDALGFDAEWRERIGPGLVDVSLDAYGWSGPWHGRRGFDSLVQMSSGIADAGMRWAAADRPVPLPVQGLDHATGYLIAATVLLGLARRRRDGRGTRARTSLAAMARTLIAAPRNDDGEENLAPESSDFGSVTEQTTWGPALRLKAPVQIAGTPLFWDFPATPLGSAEPVWRVGKLVTN